MKRIFTLLILFFLFSCNSLNKNDIKSILEEEVKFRGNLNSSEFSDYEFNDIIGSIKLDTFPKNLSLLEFFGRKGKEYEIKIIDTEKISFPFPKVLKENDFDIQKLDTTIFQLQTSERNLKRKSVSSTTYTLNFNLYDGYISVTGRMSTNLTMRMGMFSTEVGNNEISNKGMGGSPLKECFKEMNELCLKLVSQDKIEYTNKN